jgi:DNA repair exonuclease SbcCD nuclease subunit
MSLKEKVLVIGDTHFDNQYKGYLTAQLNTCFDLVKSRSPTSLIFLGDIFHHRHPDPETIMGVWNLFHRLTLIPGLSEIDVLKGNHDSANKSDDGLTVLNILEYESSKTTVSNISTWDYTRGFKFIPHFEDEEVTIKNLRYNTPYRFPEKHIVFGHFGYDGCIETGQYFNFKVKKSDLTQKTILGHIHKYSEDGNITILGTPWSTNFGESDYPHYVLELTRDDNKSDWEFNRVEVDFGVRHMVVPYPSLEMMKSEITNPKYFTLLRITLDKFNDETTNDLRTKILEEYKVGYVDLKFNPILNQKLDNRISDYVPSTKIDSLTDEVIDKYLDEQTSNLSKEVLKKGLEEIKLHENSEIKG